MKRAYSEASFLASTLAALVATAAQAQTPIINTWAGGGPAPEAPAVHVSLPAPNSVAADAAGNYYIASSDSMLIYRLSPAGTLSVFAGGGSLYGTAADGGPATAAAFYAPSQLAVRGGDLFFVDGSVRRIDILTGNIYTAVGGGASEYSEGMLATDWDGACAAGLAVSMSTGDLYISACDETIKRVDPAGRVWTVAGQPGVPDFTGDGGPATEATLRMPGSLALSPSGDLAVLDQGQALFAETRRVRLIEAGPDGLVTGDPSETITSLTAENYGTRGTLWNGTRALDADLRGLTAIAFDAAGDVLVAQRPEEPASLLWRIDSAGILRLVAGVDWGAEAPAPPGYGDGGTALDARFGTIAWILRTPKGLVFADEVFHSVRAIDVGQGTVSRLAGNSERSYSGDGGPVGASQLFEPTAIQFDAAGNAYILDQARRALRFVEAATGRISSIAPQPPFDFRPSAVAVHPWNGVIYFSNENDPRIWKLDPASGEVGHFAGTGWRTGAYDGPGGESFDDLNDYDDARYTTFTQITYLVFDQEQDAGLYVVDGDAHAVRFIDYEGTISTVAGVPGQFGFNDDGLVERTLLRYPTSAALGPDGSLYIADRGNARIRRRHSLETGGLFITTLASGYRAFGIAVDGAGRVFASSDDTHDVRVLDNGVLTPYVNEPAISGFSGDGGPALGARLRRPMGLALDAAGTLYIADGGNNRIRVITTGSSNLPPVAHDQALSATAGQPLAILLAGTDPEGASLLFTVVAPPAHGVLSGGAPKLTYTPDNGYAGPDSFTFTVEDGQNVSAPATVTIDVVRPNEPPTADPQAVTTGSGRPVSITLTGSDPEGRTLAFTVVSLPANGTLSGDAPFVTYTPNAGFAGDDTFTFTADDGQDVSAPATVTIDVVRPNEPPTADPQAVTAAFEQPVAVTLTGSDPEGAALTFVVVTPPVHGILSGTAPNLTYTPDAGFWGADSFAFTADDGSNLSAPAVVTITVIEPPPPNLRADKTILGSATPNAVNVVVGGTVTFNLLAANVPPGSGAVGPTTGPITMTDSLPPGLTFVPFGSDPRCSAAGQLVTCQEPGRLPPGATMAFYVSTIVASNLASSSQIVELDNRATVSTPGDAHPDDDTSPAVRIRVFGSYPDISIRSAEVIGGPNVARDLSLRIALVVENRGAVESFGPVVLLAPPLPVYGNRFASVTATGCTLTSGPAALSCSINRIAGGSMAAVEFSYTPDPSTPLPLGPGSMYFSLSPDPNNRPSGPTSAQVMWTAYPPTPVGSDVTVQAMMPPLVSPTGITLTFSAVTTAGVTAANPQLAPPLPANFRLKGATYDITTTAQYTAPVTVCFSGVFGLFDRVLHFENGAWVELPNQQLLPTDALASGRAFTEICAQTSTLSPFAVATQIDATPPVITVTMPGEGGTYLLHQAVDASYTCADDLSDVAACSGAVPDGTALDTTSVGEKTFTVTATDTAGNSAAKSVRYRVVYAPEGRCLWEPGHAILRPIDAGGGSVFREDRTVPARFRVCDANGRSIGTPGVVTSFRLVQSTVEGVTVDRDEPVPSSSRHEEFRWDPLGRQWIFNIDTDAYDEGRYVFRIGLADGSAIDFQFRLTDRPGRKRGHGKGWGVNDWRR
jgi:hypothetical protein